MITGRGIDLQNSVAMLDSIMDRSELVNCGYAIRMVGLDATTMELVGLGIRGREATVGMGLTIEQDGSVHWAYGRYYDCEEDAYEAYLDLVSGSVWVAGD